MDQVYKGLEPTELWQHFDALNNIPRCSGQEAAVRAYVQQVADAAGATWKVDEHGKIMQALEHDAASSKGDTFGRESGQAEGDGNGIHVLQKAESILEQVRRQRRFPGAVRSGDDNDLMVRNARTFMLLTR